MDFSGLKKHLTLEKILKKASIKKVIFLEADVRYPERSHDLHNDLPFLPDRMKI